MFLSYSAEYTAVAQTRVNNPFNLSFLKVESPLVKAYHSTLVVQKWVVNVALVLTSVHRGAIGFVQRSIQFKTFR